MPKVLEWMDWYYELEKYYEEHGNIDVPYKYETEKGLKLSSWLNHQRQAYKGKGKNKITDGQIQLLNDLGMKWEVQKENWNKYYSALKKYYEEHGNINLPIKYETAEGLKLGQWLNTQRSAYKEKVANKITEEQIQLLNDLGMKWEVQKETWDEKKYALEEYYKKYGNINVPRNYVTQEGIKLGLWLNTQRLSYRNMGSCKITQNQIQLLNDLNIEWNPCDARLLKMEIVKENRDKYYRVLDDRLDHILTDISYEVSNEITEENQGKLCKQIIKRIWR